MVSIGSWDKNCSLRALWKVRLGDALVYSELRQVCLEGAGDGKNWQQYRYNHTHWLRKNQHLQPKNIRCLDYTKHLKSYCWPERDRKQRSLRDKKTCRQPSWTSKNPSLKRNWFTATALSCGKRQILFRQKQSQNSIHQAKQETPPKKFLMPQNRSTNKKQNRQNPSRF